jgi:MFS family permease
MAIPLTPLGVGFNALFAEAVPDRYRARVAGTRNITFAIAYMLTSLIAGYLLKAMPFPTGYQIVFAIGAIGAAMSSYHIYHIRPAKDDTAPLPPPPSLILNPKQNPPQHRRHVLRLDIWKTHFKNVLLALFIFHLLHYLSNPHYPLFNVRVLNLNDSHIGNGMALYYLIRAARIHTTGTHRPPLWTQKSDGLGRGRDGNLPHHAGIRAERPALLRAFLHRRIPVRAGQRRVRQLHARKHPAR